MQRAMRVIRASDNFGCDLAVVTESGGVVCVR